MPPPKSIGEHVRYERLKRRLLQREVGELLGVCEETLVHWERGQTKPQVKDGPAIVKFLGCVPLPKVTLADRMHAFRFSFGLTMASAAEAAGVSPEGWAMWEGGAMPMAGKRKVLEAVIDQAIEQQEVNEPRQETNQQVP